LAAAFSIAGLGDGSAELAQSIDAAFDADSIQKGRNWPQKTNQREATIRGPPAEQTAQS
jgi:hypothetical protein